MNVTINTGLSPTAEEAGGSPLTRRLFARKVQNRLEDLNSKALYKREGFVELAAKVAGTGEPVRSLLAELERSKERVIVLLGEPGAGKSVVLRQLGMKLAERAARRSPRKCVIPLYVNLRDFRPSTDFIAQDEIRNFIVNSLADGDSLVADFLRKEFTRGLSTKRWLFLLDSFDEIPALLSSPEASLAIERYEAAFNAFVSGTNCRGIIASREFRGPRRLIKTKLTIAQLSNRQKQDMTRKFGLAADAREDLFAGLGAAAPALADAFDVPLTFALLCEYMKAGNPFPQDMRYVFRDYINKRLEYSDARYESGFSVGDTIMVAEEAAFVMSTQSSMGLASAKPAIQAALAKSVESPDKVEAALNALEDSRLAIPRDSTTADGKRILPFAFIHRSFQEHFLVGAALRKAGELSDDTLLTDPRFREAAVAMLRPSEEAAIDRSGMNAIAEALLDRVAELLREKASSLPPPSQSDNDSGETASPERRFGWPEGSLHLLGLISAALSRDHGRFPYGLQADAGRLIMAGWELGDRLDRKWAIEVVSVADPTVSDRILQESFESDSTLLADVAYAQARRFGELPISLDLNVRRVLIGLSRRGRLRKDRIAARARLRLLAKPDEFQLGVTLLILAPPIDFALIFAATFLCLSSSLLRASSVGVANGVLCLLGFRILRAALSKKAPVRIAKDKIQNPAKMTLKNLTLLESVPLGISFRVIPLFWTSVNNIAGFHLFGIAFLLYAIWWAPSAIIAFAWGASASIARWPSYPFCSAREIIRLPIGSARRARTWLIRKCGYLNPENEAMRPPLRTLRVAVSTALLWLAGIPLATAVVALYVAAHFFAIYLVLGISASIIVPVISSIAGGSIFLSGLAALAAMALLNSAFIYYLACRQDKKVVETALRDREKSARALPVIIAGIKTNKGLRVLIRGLQQEGLSDAAQVVAAAFLRDFSRYVEQDQRNNLRSRDSGTARRAGNMAPEVNPRARDDGEMSNVGDVGSNSPRGAPPARDWWEVIIHELRFLFADPSRSDNSVLRDLSPGASLSEYVRALTPVILPKLLLFLADPLRVHNSPPHDLPCAPSSKGITAWLGAREGARRPKGGPYGACATAWHLTREALNTPIGPQEIRSRTVDEIVRFSEG